MSYIHQLPDNRLGISVKKCGLCHNFVENVQYSIKESNNSPVMSLDDLLYQIKLDKKTGKNDMKVTFNNISMECITHKNMMPGSTSIEFTDKDLELINNTPLSKIFLSIEA